MKRIIVPVDFSEPSEYALKVAVSLAKKHDSEILALHMLELSQGVFTSPEGPYIDQSVFFIELAKKRFAEFLDKPYLKGISITPIIKHFKVFREVNEVAAQHGADLVVIGSHGAEGLKEIFIGSNAQKVVRHSDIPVLVVKDDMPEFKVDHFVFASDFKDADMNAYLKANDFARKLKAKIHLVYINIPGDSFLSHQDAQKRIDAFLSKAGATHHVQIYNDYSVEEGVLNFGETINADLVGIPTHGRKGLSHFFMGSIGEDIVNHSKIPVVTFKI
ncbi:universal stress protein [Arenibacter sp. GZD96]|uniref:universal stress protein n=1 Tax=Aurantibrevibacter litoralis TaxID=3106030 RepID=UPI002AFEE8BC|nr:universal stress protein [Arenibacter sp. GZD-96]MEA1785234.1 universal stress protein [Arenibacter sp. GZD-96]